MNEEIKSPQTIIGWTTENIKKIKLVQLKPDGKTILITGANAQGKTSLVDSYWWAIGGKNAMRKTSEPIREGEAQARARIEFQDFIVERVITRKDSYLYVTLKNEAQTRIKSPQEFLNLYRGSTSIDPTEILRLSPKEQVDLLLRLFKIYDKVVELDGKYEKIYQLRWAKGQERDSAVGALENMEIPPEGTPQEERSIVDLSNKLEATMKHNTRILDTQRSISMNLEQIKNTDDDINMMEARIIELQKSIVKQKENKATLERDNIELAKVIEGKNPINTDPIKEGIAQTEGLNIQVREAKKYNEFVVKVDELKTSYNKLGQDCEIILKQKQDILNSVKMPVEGLSIDDRGLVFGPTKRPLIQLSNSEQLKIVTAIAMAEKPTLRVLRVSHGESLDDESMNMLLKMAEENGYQPIIEKVDTSGKLGIVLEEGEVVANNPQLTHTEIRANQ